MELNEKLRNNKTTVTTNILFQVISDLMAQRLARRAEDREDPGSSPTQD